MAINVTIARGYAWRMIIIGTACVVLGAWGVYDYAVDIPRRQRLLEKQELLELVRDALETEQALASPSPEAQKALDAIMAEVERIMRRELGETLDDQQAPLTPAQQAELQQQFAQALGSSRDAEWLGLLGVITQGLYSERRLPLTEDAYPQAHLALEATQRNLDRIGQITAPGKYDRATQWAFMACLPCAVYFLWMYVCAKRRRYTLDDDGTLHSPAGTWQADEIADIDMSRWMAKSIAWAVHSDGSRLKLDDYKFRGLNRIVGAIATRLYPDEWDQDARERTGAASEPPPDRGAPGPDGDARELPEPAAGADPQ